jgi:hypothetical protein
MAMTYDDNVEAAIATDDVEALLRFAYGYPCSCTKVKGEPLCVCKMQEKALRAKVIPLPLFEGRVVRVKG